MAVKKTGQVSFVDAFLWPGAGSNPHLERLSGLVKWYRFEKIAAHLRSEASPGRPGYSVLVLLKAMVLQALYGLSDRELEEALSDRLSFRRFVGLSLDERVPDHSVLNRFRNQLVREGLLQKLFDELNKQMEKQGVILKRGTMLDATIIETNAAKPPKNETGDKEPQDPDARFARKQGKSGSKYGYKAHVGVDQGSGIIRKLIVTPANVNDTVPADALVCGDERVVLADAAYHTHTREKALKDAGIKPRLTRRANKHHPALSPRLRRYNTLIARQRSAVETTFATWKNRMRLTRIRYRGLAKATGQLLLVAFAFNMRRWSRLVAG